MNTNGHYKPSVKFENDDDLDLTLNHEDFDKLLSISTKVKILRKQIQDLSSLKPSYIKFNPEKIHSDVKAIVSAMRQQKTGNSTSLIKRGQFPETDSVIDEALKQLDIDLKKCLLTLIHLKRKNQQQQQYLQQEGSDEPDTKKRKSNSKLGKQKKGEAIAVKYSKYQTDILTNWMIQNRHHPFPKADEIKKLAKETNLTYSQVVNWTTNVRKRNMKATVTGGKKPHHFLDFLFLAEHRDKNNSQSDNGTQVKRNSVSREKKKAKSKAPSVKKNPVTRKSTGVRKSGRTQSTSMNLMEQLPSLPVPPQDPVSIFPTRNNTQQSAKTQDVQVYNHVQPPNPYTMSSYYSGNMPYNNGPGYYNPSMPPPPLPPYSNSYYAPLYSSSRPQPGENTGHFISAPEEPETSKDLISQYISNIDRKILNGTSRTPLQFENQFDTSLHQSKYHPYYTSNVHDNKVLHQNYRPQRYDNKTQHDNIAQKPYYQKAEQREDILKSSFSKDIFDDYQWNREENSLGDSDDIQSITSLSCSLPIDDEDNMETNQQLLDVMNAFGNPGTRDLSELLAEMEQTREKEQEKRASVSSLDAINNLLGGLTDKDYNICGEHLNDEDDFFHELSWDNLNVEV